MQARYVLQQILEQRAKCIRILHLKCSLVAKISVTADYVHIQGAPKGGLPGCSPPKTAKSKFKKTDSVTILISKLLRDFPSSRNQPLKSADDKYIRILKNKLIN
jgi:hypothetical protein